MPNHRAFTGEVEAEICRRYQEGSSILELVGDFGGSGGSIVSALKRSGVALRPRTERLPSTVEDEAVRRYLEGSKIEEITIALGISETPIRRALRERQIVLRGRTTIVDEQKDTMAYRYTQGESMNTLAREYDVDPATVKKWLAERNVSFHTMSESKRTLSLNEAAFDEITPDSAYWVGMLMADGCITIDRGRPTVRLGLKYEDIHHIKAFQNFLGSGHKIEHDMSCRGFRTKSGNGMARLTVYSARLAEALSRFGVVPRKSAAARVVGLENNRDFWRGAIDGDGFLRIRAGKSVIGFNGSRQMVEQYRDYVEKHCPDFGSSIVANNSIWALNLTGPRAMKMIEVLYANCTIALPRKWDVAKHFLANPYRRRLADRRWITLEILEEMYSRHGSWEGVAAELDTNTLNLATLRCKLRQKRAASR